MGDNETRARDVLTVGQLNREVKGLLEGEFGMVWVEGELSNIARPASGHMYFSLKDATAQVRCAMFRARNARLSFDPAAGTQVLVRARVSLFEARGDYQLIVEQMEPAGEGALRLKFEQLKRALDAEGLFDADAKQELPAWPQRIGVVTSPSGAAVRDIVSVLGRRCPSIPVIVYPTAVQGAGAAAGIAEAIAIANARAECDVLIVSRGGGSLEDLWSFNEEVVARAVYASEIPIVSGVGHEVDVTICDLVADVRAPTPSAAAELVSPDLAGWGRRVSQGGERLRLSLKLQLERLAETVDWLERRLVHPGRRIAELDERVNAQHERLSVALVHALTLRRLRADGVARRLAAASPERQLKQLDERVMRSGERLERAMRQRLAALGNRADSAGRALHSVSPLGTLARGYAIVRDDTSGAIARTAASFEPGDRLTATLAEGSLACIVDAVNPDGDGAG
ncbi:MAG: exodeoxyribonuclease VII large subunit [Gammaproteobacteria bacterium]|nr:exodeoxyribonuclease VII large subunit [Gammaproteobacteria bacterium]